VITTGAAPDDPHKRRRDRGTLVMLAGPEPGALYPIDPKGATVIGRGEQSTMRLGDRGLSRRHVRLFRLQGAFWIEDLRSTNGTFLNGERLDEPRELADGDRIQIGQETVLAFQLQDEEEQEAARKLYESAVKDGLTQVHNRRYLDERLEQELAYAVRHKSALSVLLLDVDHFKSVNDTFGHGVGDAVLRMLAQTVRRLVRTEDLVARYGGEEFCVVARGVPASGAAVLGERLRTTIAEMAVPLPDRVLQVTASIGVATFGGQTPYGSPEALFEAADAALYRAKETGRNRVVHVNTLR